ncbi:hypothetical protein [Xenophilus sp. Marseille-Q4582]|uniref:hypothetical protein n=1 Tax=Xenophilus sp. Marseille-Q4582 TaxID=2866600 RepID=UPI001CE3F5E6|nr:hypothetical protein [Xenophilus sp. Marseille-Q4582]
MARTPITAERMVAELNAALEAQPDYDAENRFQPFPQNASGQGIMGITTRHLWTAAHFRAQNDVYAKFEFDPGTEHGPAPQ